MTPRLRTIAPYTISTLFVIGFIVILINFSDRLVFPVDYRLFSDDGDENLVPGEPIAQTFTGAENGLTQVNLLLGGLERIRPGEHLVVSIRDAQCEKVIRIGTHQFPSHAPKQFDRFTFEPIPDSKGKAYCLTISYEALEKRKSRPFVRKMKQTGNPEEFFVNLTTGRVYTEESLIFRPAYTVPSPETPWTELNRRMSAYKASFLRGDALTVLFVLFLAGTVLVTLLFVSPRNNDDSRS